jgi:membrane protease YdiL (CAAX protease family)
LTYRQSDAGIGTELRLRLRERAGLAIGIVVLALAISPLNVRVRLWLRDEVVGGVPFWVDHILFMVTLKLVVWGVLGVLLFGPRELSLGSPTRPRQAWLVGFISGLGLLVVVAAALAAGGPLAIAWHPNWLLLFANFVSNFYEEFIFRGVILGLLLKALGRERAWIAGLISAVLFCQGHLHYPLMLLGAVFVGGVLWAWLTIRYHSLWPAWVSHTVLDAIGDSLFKV